MQMKQLKWDSLTYPELVNLILMEKGSNRQMPNRDRLRFDMQSKQMLGFYQNDTLIGYVQVNPRCAYLPGSRCIEKLRVGWESNHEEIIAQMICSAACFGQNRGMIFLDADKRHDINFQLYQKLGFQESLFRSPIGGSYVVMAAQVEQLGNIGEI